MTAHDKLRETPAERVRHHLRPALLAEWDALAANAAASERLFADELQKRRYAEGEAERLTAERDAVVADHQAMKEEHADMAEARSAAEAYSEKIRELLGDAESERDAARGVAFERQKQIEALRDQAAADHTVAEAAGHWLTVRDGTMAIGGWREELAGLAAAGNEDAIAGAALVAAIDASRK